MTTAIDQALVANLPIKQLEPSPHNRHTSDSDPDTIELANNIRAVGLLQPIVVRRIPGLPDMVRNDQAMYQILAGERRWRACRLAGRDTIEAKVVECDDRMAAEITVIENLQRKNPTPVEEARGIRVLMDMGRQTDEIAAILAKSPEWVARRAQLTELASIWADGDKDLTWATVGHLEIIARLPGDVQAEIAEWYKTQPWERPTSIKDFEKEINGKYLTRLVSAPWKLDDADLVPSAGSCVNCAKRSACQQLLFGGDLAGKNDQCLDAVCWAAKTTAHTARTAQKIAAKAERVVVLVNRSRDHAQAQVPKDLPANAVVIEGSYALNECNKTTPGAIPAVKADTGRQVYVRAADYASPELREKLGLPAKKTAGGKATGGANKDNAKVNAARREAKRVKMRIAAICEAIDTMACPDLVTLHRLVVALMIDRLDLFSPEAWSYVTDAKAYADGNQITVQSEIWAHVRELLGHCEHTLIQSTCLPDPKGLAGFEAFVGLKPDDQAAAALAEIPEPRPRGDGKAKGKAKRKGAA